MKSATKGLWRIVRCLLLIACAGGILAADNTWLSSINLEGIALSTWFSNDPGDNLATTPLADTSMVSEPSAFIAVASRQSMTSLLHGLLFSPRAAANWTSISSDGEITSAWMAQQTGAAVNQASGEYFLTPFSSPGFAVGSSPIDAVLPTGAGGLTGNWTANTSGNWGTASNWAGGVIPSGANSNAHFDTLNITTDVTVNLDTSRTVGELYIGDTDGTNHYSIAPVLGSTLTFDNAGAAAILNQTSNSAGDNIAVALLLKNDLVVSNASPTNTLTIGGGISSSAPSGTFQTVFFTGGSVTVSGNITTGTGANLSVEVDSGLVLLTGGNTYNGGTYVQGGTLLVNGDNSGATGLVQVSGSGSLLGGTGTIGSTVYMFGSNITGATSTTVGTLTLNQNLNMATGEGPGGTYIANLSGNLSDLLKITGNLTLGTGTTLSIQGPADGTTTYILATFASHFGTFDMTSGIPSGYALVYNNTDLELVPVPEPATWLGGAIAVAALLWTQRRRITRRS